MLDQDLSNVGLLTVNSRELDEERVDNLVQLFLLLDQWDRELTAKLRKENGTVAP